MEITFASRKLRRQMESGRTLQRVFGGRSKAIQRRLAVLKAARALADVPTTPPERCHRLTGDLEGHYAVDLKGNWRLVFRPDHDPLPLLPDGGLDLDRVTAIEIVGVIDYH